MIQNNKCLTAAEITRCIEDARLSAEPSVGADNDIHLSACPECRAALRSAALQSHGFEAASLFRSGCLEIETMLRGARGEADAEEMEALNLHCEECTKCRDDWENMLAFHDEVQAMEFGEEDCAWEEAAAIHEAAPQSGAGSRAVSRRIFDPARQWLQQLTEGLDTLLAALRPPQAAFGFGTSEMDSLRQPLEFADPNALGSYSVEEGRCLLHLEHTAWPADSLALLEIVETDGSPAWRRFVVMQDGWANRVANADAGTLRLENRSLKAGLVNANLLPAVSAPTLADSFQAAKRAADDAARSDEDYNAVLAWKAWAQAVSGAALDADVKAVIEDIARAE